MAFPDRTTVYSIAGAASPAYLTSSLSGSYTPGQTFTLNAASDWYEITTSGTVSSNPLGTSGPFVLTVNYGTNTEEKILCSAVNVATGVVTVWTDGTNNGRGYDATPISAHSAGSSSSYNVFPVLSAAQVLQFNKAISTAIISGTTASGDLSGTYPNPTLSGTANVQNIISNNSTVTGTAANLATLSGQYVISSGILTTATGNIASLSGSLATLSGQYVSTSGSLTTLSGQFVSLSGAYATTSGNLNTTNSNLATLSGQFVTLSGQYNTTSGIVTTATGNIALLSGSLATLSGQYVITSGIVNTISGKQVTDEANIASTSGSLATLSGQFVTLSGIAVVNGTTAAGDLSGTYPSPTVAKIQNVPVNPTTPTNLQVLRYVSASGAWVPSTGNVLVPTTTKSGNYTASINDYVLCNATSANFTVTLPNAPVNGAVVSVASQPTSTYSVTVAASGSDNIGGDGNFVLPGNAGVFTSVSFLYDSVATEWLISSNQFGNIAGGDLSGTYPEPTVSQLNGVPVSATPPNTGQVLGAVGGVWAPITTSGLGTPGPGGANGYYGAFYDSTTQSATSTTVASGSPVLVGNTFTANGITTAASGIISFGYTGTYLIAYTIQLSGTGATDIPVNVWFRKNGANVPNTMAQFSITNPPAGSTVTAAVTHIIVASGSDNFQIYWQPATTNATIVPVASGSSHPAAPSVFVSVSQIMYNQTGTYTVNSVLASGTNQTTATALTNSTYSPVTGATASGNTVSGTGVKLATPSYNGQWMQVHNSDTSNWLLLYPQSGATIDQLSANAPIWIPPSSFWEGVATTTSTWDSKITPISSPSLSVSYTTNGGQVTVGLPAVGSPGTYGTASGIPVITTDVQGRVSAVTVTGVQIAESQVTGLTTDISTLSGRITTNSGNIASLSGSLATLSGQYVATSGSLTTLSGQFVTLSGQYNTTSGIVTTATGNIASLSGSLNTVSGVAYAALPRSGGTISGALVVQSGFTASGVSFIRNNLLVSSGLTVTGTVTFGQSTPVSITQGIAVSNSINNPITITDGAGTGGAINITYNAADSSTHNFYPPALLADDTMVGQAFAQTLTNKKISGGIFLGSTVASGTLTVVSGATFSGATTINNTLTISGGSGLVIASGYGALINTSNAAGSSQTLGLKDINAGNYAAWFRAVSSGSGGGWQTINNAFTNPTFTVTDSGNVTVPGSLTATTVTGTNFLYNANNQTVTYTGTLSDSYAVVMMSGSSSTIFVVPSGVYPVGTQLNVLRVASGVAISGAAGVTIRSTGATVAVPNLRAQYSSATIFQSASNTWYVMGDVS